VLDLASGTLTQLTPERGNLFPEWMPDGRRIAWTHGGDAPAVWWQPWDASAPAERLLAGGQGTWPLGDGSAMFTIVLRPGGTRELRVVPLPIDTTRWSSPIAARRTPGFPMARPSPDGRWIAYVDEQSGVNDVFVRARADGGGRYQISLGGGTEPSWSRDGTELFYRVRGAP
jgi:Tol biopolymer transport system component